MIPTIDVPVIESSRLRLRGWTGDDIAPMRAIIEDPEVSAWLWPIDPALTGKRIQTYVEHWRARGYGQWAVDELETGVFIGRVGFAYQDDWTASPHDAEIGWTLARAAWGRGYATEAARAAMDWARERGDPRTIISITRQNNLRSRRIMEKIGLTYQGIATFHGHDQVWYANDPPEGQEGEG